MEKAPRSTHKILGLPENAGSQQRERAINAILSSTDPAIDGVREELKRAITRELGKRKDPLRFQVTPLEASATEDWTRPVKQGGHQVPQLPNLDSLDGHIDGTDDNDPARYS